MKKSITLRLRPETEDALEKLARLGKTSKGKLIESLADAAAADPHSMAMYEVAAYAENLSAQLAFISMLGLAMQRFGHSLEPEHLERWRVLMEDLNASFARKMAAEVEQQVPA